MKKIIQFPIYLEDLTETAQHYLCKTFKTTLKEEEQSIIPLAVLDREIETEEKKN